MKKFIVQLIVIGAMIAAYALPVLAAGVVVPSSQDGNIFKPVILERARVSRFVLFLFLQSGEKDVE